MCIQSLRTWPSKDPATFFINNLQRNPPPPPDFFIYFHPSPPSRLTSCTYGPATYLLVISPSALIASQLDGARVFKFIKGEGRREREPGQCEESVLQVWNAHTNWVFTQSRRTIPWVTIPKECLYVFTTLITAKRRELWGTQPSPFWIQYILVQLVVHCVYFPTS